MHKWEDSDITVPLKVIASPYREITRPVLDYVKRISKESPRTVVTVFIPEYVVGHWWEQVLHNQSALRLKGRLLFMPNVMVTSVPWQLSSSERVKTSGAALGAGRRPSRLPGLTTDDSTLTTGPPANGGSCVARHEGRVVFVRYALPGERVRVRVVADRGSYWHADVVEVIEASPDRVDSLCPIAGVDGAGCCDLAFVDPEAARRLKGAVVANQLAKLGGYHWCDESERPPNRSATGESTGWRTRVRLDTSDDGRAGFHRYHSAELVTDLRCGQLPDGQLDGLERQRLAGGRATARGARRRRRAPRRAVRSARRQAYGATQVVEGGYEATQRVNERVWRVPVTAFWQAHRDAARVYSELVAEWAQLTRRNGGMGPVRRRRDIRRGAGRGVGDGGHVVTVDTSRGASRAARAALADLANVSVVTDSVRRALTGAAAARRRGGARPAAVGRGPRGDRPAGGRRGAADHPHRL